MKKRTKIGIVAGAAILVLGAGYTVFIAPLLDREKWVYIEEEVERGTLTVGVTESGSLDYGITSVLYDLDLSVTEEDEDEDDEESEEEETAQKYLKVEEIYVAPGQRVNAGEALLKFTDDSVEGVRKLLEGALLDAKADYNEAESEYELSALEAQTNYEALKISQEYALAIYQDGSSAVDDEITSMQIEIQTRTADIASLEEKVTEATENYNEAYSAFEEAKKVMPESYTGVAESFMEIQNIYLNAQTKFRNAQSALTQAREKLEENASQIASLQAKVKDAQARKAIDKLEVQEEYLESVIDGDNAQITYDATIESLKEELQEEEESLKEAEEKLGAFEAFVGADGTLYAEGEGIVTEVVYEAGDRLINMGTVVAYAAPEDMTITVNVTQEDIVSLEVGNSVEIKFSAYPDTVYEGTILSINTTATSGESATISYQVVIAVGGDTTSLYGGMTADITFVTEEKEDVLYVSRKAIVEQNDKTYVYVKTAVGGRELQEVQTGIRNSTSVEIVSGLEEGDTIYIAGKVSDEEAVKETGEASEQKENSGDTAGPGNDEMPDFEGGEMPDFGGNMENMPDFEGSGMPDPGGDMGNKPDFGGGMPDMGNMGAPGMEGRP